jgi:polysaccharide export outer membrane protein
VTVIVKSFSPRLFYIWGQVNKPGSYPHEIGMTVQQAVATAGGFTLRARTSQFRLVRADDPDQTPKTVDKNMLVMPGDTIEIPERYF